MKMPACKYVPCSFMLHPGTFYATSLMPPDPESQNPRSQTRCFICTLQGTSCGALASHRLPGLCWHTVFPSGLEFEESSIPNWLLESPPTKTGPQILWAFPGFSLLEVLSSGMSRVGLSFIELHLYITFIIISLSLCNNIICIC